MSLIMRIGIGFDVHRFSEERDLILGGVNIPYKRGLLGHSDADVLIHAICDALLGALALGDIGTNFPPSDLKYRNISSLKLLEEVAKKIREKGYEVSNVDSVVIAEEPKIAPFVKEMRDNISSVLIIDPNRISVKATTTEELGFTGRKEGIAVKAVAILSRRD